MSTQQDAQMLHGARSFSTLSSLEKALLGIPLLGGVVFGLGPLLAQAQFAAIAGASGADAYVYHLAGAATFGYAIGLLFAILQNHWLPARMVVIATLVFNLGSLYAVAAAVINGGGTPIVYLICLTSLIIIGATVWMLNQHRGVTHGTPDIAPWLVYLIAFLGFVAAAVGLTLIIAPVPIAQIFGYKGTDDFLYRQGGAATLGYGVMGYYMLRSRVWSEIRLASIMSFGFNAISLVAAVLEIASGGLLLLAGITGLVALIATLGMGAALLRHGK
ncbi:MAG TPA: hypothetical protein VFD70_08500 [Anaerolineae bacterium]|nr:hypothetical protein [Anaerolineae bacterium]